ncbi:MAG: hypothetical protein KME15_21570 [Drouetiella hepatica Uher 2000/2452]|jgi:hypothetical protein|uniref:Uncharacterized protein n=1 Tax=Drouetiella hepatica Uher 2000/2452 TaxID=904376 RepID=A0A951QDI2_9CYAN|nr:hypothetical protein [Drouetiella hepatica Uher 2000/2452]
MITTNLYYLRVDPDTRNDKGSFVEDTVYKLMEIEPSGWALICHDEASCHYVDPDALRELSEDDR